VSCGHTARHPPTGPAQAQTVASRASSFWIATELAGRAGRRRRGADDDQDGGQPEDEQRVGVHQFGEPGEQRWADPPDVRCRLARAGRSAG